MDESRILIIGAYGQLGKALCARYPGAQAVDRDKLDMTDWAAVASYDWSKVDVIINAAGSIDVDGAETPEGRAPMWRANAIGPSNLARIAAQHDLTIVHASSDYVFDGATSPHTEAEAVAPLGVYGQAKAAADLAVSVHDKHYILRISWLIGDGDNFVRVMMNLAAKNVSPKVVHDQTGRLTFTNTLAMAIDHLLRTKAPFGIYNVSNDGQVTSWADITRAIFELLQRTDLQVTNTTAAEYFANKPHAAPRPAHSEYALAKIQATGLQLPDWRDDLAQYIKAEQAKPKEQA